MSEVHGEGLVLVDFIDHCEMENVARKLPLPNYINTVYINNKTY